MFRLNHAERYQSSMEAPKACRPLHVAFMYYSERCGPKVTYTSTQTSFGSFFDTCNMIIYSGLDSWQPRI